VGGRKAVREIPNSSAGEIAPKVGAPRGIEVMLKIEA
jgi:hypothetical protein